MTLKTPEILEAEISAIRRGLAETFGNVAELARKLGVSRATIYRALSRHGIHHDCYRIHIKEGLDDTKS